MKAVRCLDGFLDRVIVYASVLVLSKITGTRIMHKINKLRISLLILLAGVGLILFAATHPMSMRAQSPAVTLTRYPYIQMQTTSSVLIAWRTDEQ
jgi:purine-cytosine permease-like protein